MIDPRTTSSGQSLVSSEYATPPMLVPDSPNADPLTWKPNAFKVELVVSRSPELTIKYLWWYGSDPREEPHNHPWEYFNSHILGGGYTEDRYWVDAHRKVRKETKTYREGDINHVPGHIFHFVYDVQPQTRTRLECVNAVGGNPWGYIDIKTGQYEPWNGETFADKTFLLRAQALNPHMRKNIWD